MLAERVGPPSQCAHFSDVPSAETMYVPSPTIRPILSFALSTEFVRVPLRGDRAQAGKVRDRMCLAVRDQRLRPLRHLLSLRRCPRLSPSTAPVRRARTRSFRTSDDDLDRTRTDRDSISTCQQMGPACVPPVGSKVGVSMADCPEGFTKIRLRFMPASELYASAEFTLDATERRLSRHGRPISLEPKTHDVLVALVRHAGRLVTKRELLDRDDSSERCSLAVLPARPLTIEILSERDRNLGLAMSDTLIDRLAAIPQLVVRPTGSAS
jgi:hypothetical protein